MLSRGGAPGEVASSCPYDKHGQRHRVWLKQMGDISRRDKCREWLNQKKSTNTFKCTITRTVSLQSLGAEEISIRRGRERKEANICELGMGIKSWLLLGFFFLFWRPLPILLPPPTSSFYILLPSFRMGVHDWLNGLVSCKATAWKTRSFLLTFLCPNGRKCTCTSWQTQRTYLHARSFIFCRVACVLQEQQ